MRKPLKVSSTDRSIDCVFVWSFVRLFYPSIDWLIDFFWFITWLINLLPTWIISAFSTSCDFIESSVVFSAEYFMHSRSASEVAAITHAMTTFERAGSVRGTSDTGKSYVFSISPIHFSFIDLIS